MKSIIKICVACCLVSSQIVAQKITVAESSENFGEGFNAAIKLFVPHTNAKTMEKKWISFLKDYRAKVKSNKDEIDAQNFVLKAKDTLQVFSRINESTEGVTLVASFMRENVYISKSTSESDFDKLSRMLHDFVLPVAKDALDKKIETSTDILEEKTKDRDNLVKRNEHLHDANEKMKGEISDNEREMSDNDGKVGSLKTVIEQQQKAVEEVKAKAKDLE